MKTILYSLKNINDKSVLSIDLTALVVSETHYQLHIKLPSGEIYLDKSEWLNRMKVYDDGTVFFIVCGYKRVSRASAFKCLLNHAINKIDTQVGKLSNQVGELSNRVERLSSFKERLHKEMVAA